MNNVAVTASPGGGSSSGGGGGNALADDAHRLAPILHSALPTPTPAPRFRVRLSPAGPALWRVVNSGGRVIGHLQRVDHGHGTRWASRRYRAGVGGFRTIGEFWSVDEAVSALSAS